MFEAGLDIFHQMSAITREPETTNGKRFGPGGRRGGSGRRRGRGPPRRPGASPPSPAATPGMPSGRRACGGGGVVEETEGSDAGISVTELPDQQNLPVRFLWQ